MQLRSLNWQRVNKPRSRGVEVMRYIWVRSRGVELCDILGAIAIALPNIFTQTAENN
jgi:hypothetical protein